MPEVIIPDEIDELFWEILDTNDTVKLELRENRLLEAILSFCLDDRIEKEHMEFIPDFFMEGLGGYKTFDELLSSVGASSDKLFLDSSLLSMPLKTAPFKIPAAHYSRCIIKIFSAITEVTIFDDMDILSVCDSDEYSHKFSLVLSPILEKSLIKVNISHAKTIPRKLFWFFENLNEVNLCEGIERIGDFAFGNCRLLQNIKLPDSLKEIGVGAFSDSGLRNIRIPKAVERMGGYTFSNTMEQIIFDQPSSLKRIDNSTFAGCHIETIDIPEGVKIIGDSVFSYNDDLESVTLPSTLKKLRKSAFGNEPNSKLKIKLKNGISDKVINTLRSISLIDRCEIIN